MKKVGESQNGRKVLRNKKITLQYVVLTFIIAYSIGGLLIFFGNYGYSVYNWVSTFQQFIMNVPFSIYILSPAIACFIVLKHNHKLSVGEWLKTVFHFQNGVFSYLFVILGIVIYFSVHIIVIGELKTFLPFYTILLSIPGNLIIGGLEEAGWMYILQPELNKKYVGFWHIPLFFIAGTNHGDGLIDFWMFNVQLMAFRFFNGAIYKVSGKGCIFITVRLFDRKQKSNL